MSTTNVENKLSVAKGETFVFASGWKCLREGQIKVNDTLMNPRHVQLSEPINPLSFVDTFFRPLSVE